MLIVALAVLTLLVVLGTTFVQLMRLEQQASENNIDTQRMDWVSSSALDRAITTLYEADNHYSWTYYQNTNWLYKFNKLGEAGSLAVGRVEVEDPRVGRWENYMEVSGFLYRFKSKVISHRRATADAQWLARARHLTGEPAAHWHPRVSDHLPAQTAGRPNTELAFGRVEEHERPSFRSKLPERLRENQF